MIRTSQRLDWGAGHNALSLLLDEKRAAGARMLDLTVSNPTAAGIDYPTEAIRTALADPRAVRYQPTPRGLDEARAAVASYYGSRGFTVGADDLLLTASTSEAYAFLFKLLCDPGDAVLVPQPCYPLFDFLAALETVRLVPFPLGFDGHWFFDFAALQHAIDGCAGRARAILIVNPNNPTGSFLKQDERARLVELSRAADLPLIVDEVFADYEFGGGSAGNTVPAREATTAQSTTPGHETVLPPSQPPGPSLLGAGASPLGDGRSTGRRRVTSLVDEEGAHTFSLSGLSKVVGLPQLKLGWIHVAGPRAERAAILSRLELIADTYLSVGAPVQLAAGALLELQPRLGGAIAARTARNLAALQHALAGTAMQLLPVEGGWYGVVRLPALRTDEAWALSLLRDEDVLVQPGYFYDFPGRAPHVIVSLLSIAADFDAGVARLVAHVAGAG